MVFYARFIPSLQLVYSSEWTRKVPRKDNLPPQLISVSILGPNTSSTSLWSRTWGFCPDIDGCGWNTISTDQGHGSPHSSGLDPYTPGLGRGSIRFHPVLAFTSLVSNLGTNSCGYYLVLLPAIGVFFHAVIMPEVWEMSLKAVPRFLRLMINCLVSRFHNHKDLNNLRVASKAHTIAIIDEGQNPNMPYQDTGLCLMPGQV